MTVIGTHDPYLVALSFAVACLASYAALDLGSRIRVSGRWARLAWLATAAIAMGGGIWSMHFIAMLAFFMPMPVSFDFGLTLLSLVVAIGVTGFGFFTIGTRQATAFQFVLSGIYMGIGIAAMHYTGMAAMRMPADLRYDRVLVALSVLIAIGASIAALWLALRTTLAWQRLLAAVVMGSAISGMHYTGMAAATFIAQPGMDEARSVPGLAQTDLALLIATITFVILLLALVASASDREVQLGLTRNSEKRFRATFENAAVGIAHVGPDGGWLRVNATVCRILGYRVDELLAKSFQDVTYPDDLAADMVQLELMREGKIDSYDAEERYLRKDGAIIWARKTVGCVRKGDGSIDYFVSVIEDISARKQAEKEVRESEGRFRFSLLHCPLPILLFDDREQIFAISQSWLEQSGYLREELRRVEDWAIRAHGARSGEVLEQIRQITMISTEPEVRSAELVIRTKDGRERLWSFAFSALPPPSDDRRRLFVCIAQDVTDQKAHQEQVHLLMREINHRAKNMLSLVQAIARQTAAREPEDFIECFTERIQALAANQDLLVRNEWQGVDVEDLVRAQLSHFADLVGSRITVHGSPVRLNAAAAQAIGLALHELATNAGKYGALSVDAGCVDVGWRFDGDIFGMNWTERRGPPVSQPKRRGFGSTVVDSMVKQTVNGEVQLDYIPSGVVWNLTCPAANALERNALYKNSESSTLPASAPARNHALRQLPVPAVH
jgi:PAS domain S-box-containing protein